MDPLTEGTNTQTCQPIQRQAKYPNPSYPFQKRRKRNPNRRVGYIMKKFYHQRKYDYDNDTQYNVIYYHLPIFSNISMFMILSLFFYSLCSMGFSKFFIWLDVCTFW